MLLMTSNAQAKRFAKAMRASLIFSSTSHSINVQKVSLQIYASTPVFTPVAKKLT